jgi:hypothetical protein
MTELFVKGSSIRGHFKLGSPQQEALEKDVSEGYGQSTGILILHKKVGSSW